ncbi:MAG: hypothetical protein AB7J35_11195 [Dehalococcoidia bacterium]
MSGESFQQRVELLRDSWAERRQLKGLAGAHDFESQLGLLRTLHEWSDSAVKDIRAVYGKSLATSISPAPTGTTPNPGFSVTLGDQYTLTFSLNERRREGGSRWFVSVTVSSGGPGGNMVTAGPERRNGQWTRSRVEDILLSVLGAYERAASEQTRGSGGQRARGA